MKLLQPAVFNTCHPVIVNLINKQNETKAIYGSLLETLLCDCLILVLSKYLNTAGTSA